MTEPSRLARLRVIELDIRRAADEYQVGREDLPADPDGHPLAGDLDQTIAPLGAVRCLLELLPARAYIPF